MQRFQQVLINLQQKRLNKGVNTQGDEIGTYSFFTEQIAKTQNPRKPKIAGQPYNYEYSGGFFDGMQAVFSVDSVEFISRDSKTPFLVSRYDYLLGQSTEDLQQFTSKLLYPAYMIQVRNKLKL